MALLNQRDIEKSYPKIKPRSNLTWSEKQAKLTLSKNPNIVIKKADKGSAVVLQNRSDYIKEGLRQLKDRDFYRLQEDTLTEIHNNTITKEVTRMYYQGEIHLQTAEYLVAEKPRTPNLYLLPKIHKNVLPLPGRPIVLANECPTEKISQFADFFLQPIIPKLPSFLKDSGAFINTLLDLDIPEGAILATMDVTSLYTNIPTPEGITAVGKALATTRHPNLNPTNRSLCKLLELVLTCNNFQFHDKDFLQISGTAMGTKLAPAYANIFMGDFENRFVYPYHTQPLVWKRYIGDVFIIWTHGKPALDIFLHHLDICHKTIKFTMEDSTTTVNFLDITVIKNTENILETTLYCKPTDSHNYLLYSSEHPRHVVRAIPYSQVIRVKWICTRDSEFLRNSLMLCTHLLRRKYPRNLLLDSLTRSKLQTPVELIKPKTKLPNHW